MGEQGELSPGSQNTPRGLVLARGGLGAGGRAEGGAGTGKEGWVRRWELSTPWVGLSS